MTRKIFALINIILAITVLILVVVINYSNIPAVDEDWLNVSIEFFPSVLVILFSFLLWRMRSKGLVGKGLVWGAFISSFVFMIFHIFLISIRFTEILQDAESWGIYLVLTPIFIGGSALVIGLIVGASSGWIRKTIIARKKTI